MLTCQRGLFSLPEDEHYLNCAYMSPLLKSVEAAGIAGLRGKCVPRHIAAADFFSGPNELRKLFGKLVNAPPERVALVPSVSYGVAIAAQNLPLAAGKNGRKNIVIPGEEFPSNVYAWMEQAAREGAELRFVERPRDVQSEGDAWNHRILEAIGNHTAAVSLTAVHWTDGTRFDLAAIGRRAREVGALFVVDGTQSIGALPFDWESVRPDLLVCAGYKWLLGPYQLAFVVMGDRLIEGRPLEMTWIGRENSEDFAALIDYQTGFQPGARRFDAGEHSNFINVPMQIEALRQILEWGVENIQNYCAMLGRSLAEALGEGAGNDAGEDAGAGFTLNPPEDRGAHLFGVRLPDAAQIPAVLEQLAARKVFVSQRGASLRVSPHLYNTVEDMAALAEALRATVI